MASSSLRALLIVAITTVLAVVGSNAIIYVTDLLLEDYSARFDNYAFATGIPLAISPLLIVPLALAIYRLTELRATLERNIRTDALTGLFNRHGFFEHAQRVFDATGEGARRVAVMMIDVDNFKTINDTFGHAAGDEFLREISRRVVAAIGSASGQNVAARIGGDEFAVLLTGLEAPAAAVVADRLCRMVSAPVAGAEPGMPVPTVSVGLAMREPGQPVDAVMKAADDAAYEAKRAGRNRWVQARGVAAGEAKPAKDAQLAA